ncbi:MAG: hypothetical protein ABL871_19380 [Terricaulis sp.]
MRRHLLTAAAVATALMAFAQPASAQQYRSYHDEHVSTQQQCQTSRNNRTAGGAVIGGVLGALLGREVADRGVRGEGAGLGAVVGAVAGGAVGRSTARCDQFQGQYDQYGRPVAYGQQPYYGNEGGYRDDDLYGGPNDDGYYRGDDRDCRMGQQITRAPNGREYREDVMMCRGDDGEWRPEYSR